MLRRGQKGLLTLYSHSAGAVPRGSEDEPELLRVQLREDVWM